MDSVAHAIAQLKQTLGNTVCIVGHHYQAENIITHCDIMGDSLELARQITHVTAPHIVFCGVYFMGESAALLAREGQNIYLPEPAADCFMAQMAHPTRVASVLYYLQRDGRKVIPLAYVNTSLAVKAVVGDFGGAVCTSANARTMLDWAMHEGDAVVFLPDKHLAYNTAQQLCIPETSCQTLNIRQQNFQPPATDALAKLYIWPGCCAVHTKFTPEHVHTLRATYPQALVAVHPECSPAVVQCADAAGSTSFLIDYVKNAPAQSTVIIGTETNLVERLQRDYAAHCTVIPLRRAFCSHMAKVTQEKLLHVLTNIATGTAEPVRIQQHHKKSATAALTRMLDVCATAGV